MLTAELQSSQTTMRCSGSRNCNCTNFQRKKRSTQCKSCSHDRDDHATSSDSDDSRDDTGNSDDGRAGKLPPSNAKNTQTVSSLISDLIQGGEYAAGKFEHARDEARAGLMKKRVGQLTVTSQLTIQTHHTITQHQMEPKTRQGSFTKPPKGDLPDIKSAAKVLKIIMFPYGKKVSPSRRLVGSGADLSQNASLAKYPYLTALESMERQGLVASSAKGIIFCKEWNAKQMCLFFQQNLPRPFQYFAESEGFDQQKLSSLEGSLPYCLLRKVRQVYSIVPEPEKRSDLTGKFYHDNATGTKSSGYKNRLIILSKSKSLSLLRVLADSTDLSVSKKPIPKDVLDEWERCPVPKKKEVEGKEDSGDEGSAAGESDEEPGELVHASSSRAQKRSKQGSHDGVGLP